MGDSDITPTDRPSRNPANARIANEMSGLRHVMTNWAYKLGDLERTVRLIDTEVSEDSRRKLSAIVKGTAQDLLAGAQRIEEAK